MRIITSGNQPKEVRHECDRCGCIFACTSDDGEESWNASTQSMVTIVECPECNQEIEIQSDLFSK